MDNILEYLESLTKKDMQKKLKKFKIHGCFFCKAQFLESEMFFDLFVDDKQVYVCEECIDSDRYDNFRYCHNCEASVDPYGCLYHCTKCPDEINVLCSTCHKLHNTLIKCTSHIS
jgi:hypothetical protein